MVPPYALLPFLVPLTAPTRPSSHTPTIISVSSVCVRETVLQPVPIAAKSISTPWIPYQKKSGWLGSNTAGVYTSAPNTLPYLPSITSCIPSIYRREEVEKNGILYCLES